MKDDKAGRDKQKRLREEAIAAQTAAKLAKSGATEKASSRSDAASPAPNGTDKGKAAVKQDTKGKKRTRGEAFDTVSLRRGREIFALDRMILKLRTNAGRAISEATRGQDTHPGRSPGQVGRRLGSCDQEQPGQDENDD
jgi:hypothetical protein